MNKVLLIGRLTRDAELSQSGSTYAKFTLAVNRQFKEKDGSKKADFINCVAFGKAAEVLTRYTQKGSQIGVEGSLQVSSYEKNGVKQFSTSVVVESIELLGSKGEQEQSNYQQPQSTYKAPANPYQQTAVNQQQENTVDPRIYDEDIPF
jgi:single-strand DNA-binding protein